MDTNSTGGLRLPMLWPLIAALLFFGGGHIGNHFVNPQTHVAYVWPATGVTIAVLSLVPIARWPMYLVAIGLAAVGVSLVFGESIGISLVFAAVELATSGLAAWALQRLLGCPPRLDSLRGVALFSFVGALGAALLSATLGAAIVTRGQGATFATASGRSWSRPPSSRGRDFDPNAPAVWRAVISASGWFSSRCCC